MKSSSHFHNRVVVVLIPWFAVSCMRPVPMAAPSSGIFSKPPLWEFQSDVTITATPAADDDGRIFVRTQNSVIAISRVDGTALWQALSPGVRPPLFTGFPGLIVSPVVSEGLLLVPEGESRVAAFSTSDGSLVWRTSVFNPRVKDPSIFDIRAIAVSDDTLYVARFDWGVYAYNIADGAWKWQADISDRASSYLAAGPETLYLASDTRLRAFDLGSGILAWEQTLGHYLGPISLSGSKLYFTDEAAPSWGSVDLDGNTSNTLGELPADERYGIRCMTTAEDRLIIAGTHLTVVSLPSGQVSWEGPRLGSLECPAVIADTLFARNIGNTLYAFQFSTGDVLGTLSVEADTTTLGQLDRGPLASGPILIVPVSGRRLAAYRFP